MMLIGMLQAGGALGQTQTHTTLMSTSGAVDTKEVLDARNAKGKWLEDS